MRDSQTEIHYYPKLTLPLGSIGSALCLAPHPDDEVLGCGGLLCRLAELHCQVDVLIFSRGENARNTSSLELADERVLESRRAARVLGLKDPFFLDWPDRGMHYGEPLIAAILEALARFQPQYLILPSLSEPHPDHQAVALAGMAAAQRSAFPQTLLFYEVGAPLHPNVLFDLGGAAARKWQAVREFVSQLAIQPYEAHAQAMASVRAFGVGGNCVAAEAYFLVAAEELRRQGAAAAMPFWPMVRAEQGLANSPQQLPLVSVLIRSIDRPQLQEAVASVIAQTYSNLEIVLINASGQVHSPVSYPLGRLNLRIVEPGHGEAGESVGTTDSATRHRKQMDRSRAGNLALRSAKGDLALFLDDDDLIEPEHVQRLVDALASRATAVAAYSGVRVEGPDGAHQRDYDLPWSLERLNGINFLPIHAVLFRLDVVREGALEFDDSLPVLEDWDFWRKLATKGEFVHCAGVSALYRQGHGSSGIGDPLHPNHWRLWHRKIVERDLAVRTSADAAATLAWHSIELDSVQARLESLQARFEGLQAALEQQSKQLAETQEYLSQTTLELSERRQELAQAAWDSAVKKQALDQAAADLDYANAVILAKEDLCRKLQEQHAQAQLVQREQHKSDYAQLEAQIQMMLRSRSWRLTRPLRAITNRFQANSS